MRRRDRMERFAANSLPVALLAILLLACGRNEPADVQGPVSSRSYRGHEDDTDANNLVRAYPSVVGSRLDDCRT